MPITQDPPVRLRPGSKKDIEGTTLGRKTEMFNLKSIVKSAVVTAVALSFGTTAFAGGHSKVLRIQSVLSDNSDELKMLKNFGEDVAALTGGSLVLEVLPAGAIVGSRDVMDAVDAGLVEGGFAWTHYWGGKHPAANLFGAPVAGAGVGLDNLAFLSWFEAGGGKELYERLWDEMGVNVKGFMLQPVGPEALGWFKEPITSMDDFRKYRFRAPPGMVGQAYKDIGVASVAMGGGDILPALEKGTIDAAEWCCPVADMAFGFQKVLKHYYLQGLHQVVVNADMYVNGDFYAALTDTEKKALEVAANASLSKSMSYRIYENGKALKTLVNDHGVTLHDTPADYFPAYMAAAKNLLEKGAADNAFFAEVWQSQKDFADIAVPFWAGAQATNAALGKAHADSLK
jgi:TRAP-type mannitol/chloroaromatic compound transport system substrate-binding protein